MRAWCEQNGCNGTCSDDHYSECVLTTANSAVSEFKKSEKENPFENLLLDMFNEEQEYKNLDIRPSIESEFAKVLQSGNIDYIINWIANTIKENVEDAQHIRSTAHFEKGKTENERDVEAFENAVKYGFFKDAMDALNRMHKKILKQEKNRRTAIYV